MARQIRRKIPNHAPPPSAKSSPYTVSTYGDNLQICKRPSRTEYGLCPSCSPSPHLLHIGRPRRPWIWLCHSCQPSFHLLHIAGLYPVRLGRWPRGEVDRINRIDKIETRWKERNHVNHVENDLLFLPRSPVVHGIPFLPFGYWLLPFGFCLYYYRRITQQNLV